jgi:putative addiction module component (TIGR02574 family)
MDIADIHKLNVNEKLKLVTKLWDEIATSHEPIVVPPEIVAEATRRSAEIKADPSIGIDDDELWRRVDG